MRDESHVRCLAVSEWRKLFADNGLCKKQARMRKKRFAFPSWVRRTAQSEEQVQAVENLLLQADAEMSAYFSIETDAGKVLSHQIDEWMVMCMKGCEQR
jgi:hypothetical protein